MVDMTNEYLHFCSKHLYHNKNQHSLHCKAGAEIPSNLGSTAEFSLSAGSSSSSFDLTCHNTISTDKMTSNQSLIDVTTNSNDVGSKNNISNVTISLNTSGAYTSEDSNFTANMNNYFGVVIGSKKKHEAKIPTNQLKYEENLRMNIINLYREPSLIEEYLLRDGFINGGDGFTLVPFYYSEDNSTMVDFDSRNKVYMCFAKEWEHTGEDEDPRCYYRYDLLAAVCLKRFTVESKILEDGDNEFDDKGDFERGKMRHRTYVSMCRLNSNTVYKDDFILVALLMTLCKDKRIDSIVYNTKIRQILVWKDTQVLENFYCDPKLDFDVDIVNDEWNKFVNRYSWIYKQSRKLPRDIHDPAKRGLNPSSSMEVLISKEKMWKKIIRTKLKNQSVLSDVRQTRGRSVQSSEVSTCVPVIEVDGNTESAMELKCALLHSVKEMNKVTTAKEKLNIKHDKLNSAHEKLKATKKAVQVERDNLQEKNRDLAKALREATSAAKKHEIETDDKVDIPNKHLKTAKNVENEQQVINKRSFSQSQIDSSDTVIRVFDHLKEQTGSFAAKEDKLLDLLGETKKDIRDTHNNYRADFVHLYDNALAAVLESQRISKEP